MPSPAEEKPGGGEKPTKQGKKETKKAEELAEEKKKGHAPKRTCTRKCVLVVVVLLPILVSIPFFLISRIEYRRLRFPPAGPGDRTFKQYRYTYESTVSGWPVLDTKEGLPPEQRPTLEWFDTVAETAVTILTNTLYACADESALIHALLDLASPNSGSTIGHYINFTDITLNGVKAGLKYRSSVGDANKDGRTFLGFLGELVFTGGALFFKYSPFILTNAIKHALRNHCPHGRPESIDDYKIRLFKALHLPLVAYTYENDDAVFAELRVSGFNPKVIKGIRELPKHFPVTDEMLARATGKGDTLARAGQEGRLYIADYGILTHAQNGTFKEGTKAVFSPIALFALPPGKGTRKLVSVAIQCGQDPKDNPVHTPADTPPEGSKKSDPWEHAKHIVQQADATHHELISHLADTHLLVEPFIIATHNQLGYRHPIGRLLTPHGEGTISINNLAVNNLLAKDGEVSEVLGSTINSSNAIAKISLVDGYQFNDRFLPRRLELQHVTSKDLHYPWRDDALLIWNTIHDWVENYVNLFYKKDCAVENDKQLQRWATEIVSEFGGRMKGFGETDKDGKTILGKLTTKKYLVDAVTLIIYTGSADHAAVNFAQPEMTYAPVVPGAYYSFMKQCPYYLDDHICDEHAQMLAHLPPLETALLQVNFLTLLGSVHYTKLGGYQHDWPINKNVVPLMQLFQRELEKATQTIDKRNLQDPLREPDYLLLRPPSIPQSINI